MIPSASLLGSAASCANWIAVLPSYDRTVEYLALTGLGEPELDAIRYGNAQALFSAAGRPQSISMS